MDFHYYTRDFVNGILRLGGRQSYRVVPATPSGRIRSDGVVALLNRARVGMAEPLTRLPCDLMTPEETVDRFAASGITLGDLRRWTRRSRRVPPFFRINRNTIRFSAAMLDGWLAKNSIPGGRR